MLDAKTRSSKRTTYSSVVMPQKLWIEVSPTAHAVYHAMASIAGRERLFTQTREWLAEHMPRNGKPISAGTITSAWKELEAKGYLDLIRDAYRDHETGRQAPKCWKLTFKGLPQWQIRHLQGRERTRLEDRGPRHSEIAF